METALVHTARVLRSERTGARNAQGEYEQDDELGPVFDCRLQPYRASEEQLVDDGSRRRTVKRHELLWMPEAQDGTLVDLSGGLAVEVDAPEISAGDRWLLTGEPEDFYNGDVIIGFGCDVVRVKDSA